MNNRVIRRAALISAGALVASAATLAIEAALAMRVERIDPFTREQLDATVGDGEPAIRLVWLGDSTGDGVGAGAPENALPRLVAAGLQRTVSLSVLAQSGDTAADVLRDQAPRVASLDPDWVVVCVGGNDVTHLTSRADLRRQMDAILSAVEAARPKRIIVAGIGEFAVTPLLAQPLRAVAGWRADALDDIVRDVARAHDALYVDIAGRTGAAFAADPAATHARDKFHPSDVGYRLWADAILATVAEAGW